MNTPSYVYGLWEPDDINIRYVGFSRDPQKRLGEHLNFAKRDTSNVRRCNWLGSLGERHPVMHVLEVSDTERVKVAERAWIEYLRSEGCDLVNLTDGGDGSYGWIMPIEVRAKIGMANRGRRWTSEQREKTAVARSANPTWGKWNAGQKRPMVTAANRCRVVTPEGRARRSAALRGRAITPEHQAKINETKRARAAERGAWYSPEAIARMSEGQRRRWAKQPLVWTWS